MHTVRELIKGPEVVCVNIDDTVRTAVNVLAKNRVGLVAVLDGDRLSGVFSERDLVTRVVSVDKSIDDTLIKDVMTKNLIVVDAGESIEDARAKLRQINARHLPVIENDSLIGIISVRDFLFTEIDKKEEELKWLNAYIHYTPPGKE